MKSRSLLQVTVDTRSLLFALIGTTSVGAFFLTKALANGISELSSVSLSILFVITSICLLFRIVWNSPVLEILENELVLSNPYLPRRDFRIPITAILRARCFWSDASSPEDSITLLLELQRTFNWKSCPYLRQLSELERTKLHLKSDGWLLEFKCANCIPKPKVVCERINRWLDGTVEPPAEKTSGQSDAP